MFIARVFGRRAATFPAVVRLQGTRAESTTGYGNSSWKGGPPAKETADKEHQGPLPVDKKGSDNPDARGKPTDTGNSSSHPQPKIFDQKEPNGAGNADVQKHNKEMDQRYGKNAPKDENDKVGKQYWKGIWSSAGFFGSYANVGLKEPVVAIGNHSLR